MAKRAIFVLLAAALLARQAFLVPISLRPAVPPVRVGRVRRAFEQGKVNLNNDGTAASRHMPQPLLEANEARNGEMDSVYTEL